MSFGNSPLDDDGEVMSEINMTPLVDVMLVLLIIFIITVPVINHAVKLDLPKASSQAEEIKPEKINLSIKADGSLGWNGESVPEEMLEACPGVQLPDTLTDGEPWDGSFERESDAPARAGALIGELQDTHDQDDVVAVVTHPHFGQLLLQTGVGFRGDARAFVLDTASATAVQLGDIVHVQIRDKQLPARVVKLPFVRNGKKVFD